MTVESLVATAYTVPTDAPEADGTLAWDHTTMVLVEVTTSGVTGTGWTYGPASCAGLVGELLAPQVLGSDPMDVPGTFASMVRAVRNAGRAGAAGYAVSAVDLALWDLKARLLGLPLYRLLGTVLDSVPIYGSGGFTTYSASMLREQLDDWVTARRIPRVKIKVGTSWGSDPGGDVRRIEVARDAAGDAQLYVDANGAYSAKQAIRLAHAARDADVRWFEEPVSSDDLDGLRQVRTAVAPDVTAGEYGCDLAYFRRMCAAGAVDCLQADVTRCGGVTEWLRVAAVAAAHNLEISGHCAPHAHAHVAAATPNLRHLEWFHDHVRIEGMFFDGVLDPAGGRLTPNPLAAGNGLTLRADVADRYRAGEPVTRELTRTSA